jgi:hypothetical protein
MEIKIMRAIKFLLILIIVAFGGACTQSPGNDPADGNLEISVGEFDESGTAPVTVIVTTPSDGGGQLFLDIVPGGATLAQKEWDLNFEAEVPQTITTSIQINETTPAGGAFKLTGGFMDPKHFVHKDVVNIYVWPEGARALQPGEKPAPPPPPPLEIREVTPDPSPF